jgi:hypothetical protein
MKRRSATVQDELPVFSSFRHIDFRLKKRPKAERHVAAASKQQMIFIHFAIVGSSFKQNRPNHLLKGRN